eukprot:TRINITY_DN8365_c0_g1_i1.p1 TRINITY_DN8365_c0_g1~~TRINITY_DN8365_c0_g1_i1.p1  ORF type:complete len:924 (-),score=130.10 TRINITY_DN8365_c0_g1_i1:49-2703(-)
MAAMVYGCARLNDLGAAKKIYRTCVDQQPDKLKSQLTFLNGRAALAIGMRELAREGHVDAEFAEQLRSQAEEICGRIHVPHHERAHLVSSYPLEAMMVAARSKNSPERAQAAAAMQRPYAVRVNSLSIFHEALDIIAKGTPEVRNEADPSTTPEILRKEMLTKVIFYASNALEGGYAVPANRVELERNRLYQEYARILLTLDRYEPQAAGHYRTLLDQLVDKVGSSENRHRVLDPQARVRIALAFIHQAILHQRWDLAYRLAPIVWQDGRIAKGGHDVPHVTELLSTSSVQQLLARGPDHAVSKPVVSVLRDPGEIRQLIAACRDTPAMGHLTDICRASKGELPLLAPLVLHDTVPRSVVVKGSNPSWSQKFNQAVKEFVDCTSRRDLPRLWGGVTASLPSDEQIPYTRTYALYNHALMRQQPALALSIIARYVDFMADDEEARTVFFNFLNGIVKRSLAYNVDPHWISYTILEAVSHCVDLGFKRTEHMYARLFSLLGRTTRDKKFPSLLAVMSRNDPHFLQHPYKESDWWSAYGLGTVQQAELKLNFSGEDDSQALSSIGNVKPALDAVRDITPGQPLAQLGFDLRFHHIPRMRHHTTWADVQAELDASPFEPNNMTWYHGTQLSCGLRIARKGIDMEGVRVCFSKLTAALPAQSDMLGKRSFDRTHPQDPVDCLDEYSPEELWFRVLVPVTNAFARYDSFATAVQMMQQTLPQLSMNASASKGEPLYRQMFFAALGWHYVQYSMWDDATQALEQALPVVLDPAQPLAAGMQGSRPGSMLPLFLAETLNVLAENHPEHDMGPWILQQMRAYEGYEQDIFAIEAKLGSHARDVYRTGLRSIIRRLQQAGGGAVQATAGHEDPKDDLAGLLKTMAKKRARESKT